MITIQLARLTPDERGRPRFTPIQVEYRPDFNVCTALDFKPAQIDRVICRGRSYVGNEVVMVPVRDGDELHVLPYIEGKNAALILGVVGAIVGFYLGGPGGASAGWTWGAALQGAMTGFAIGSTVGSLLAPRPSIGNTDGAVSTYQFQGITNSDLPGSVIPVVLGKRKTGGLRIGAFIRREGTSVERMGVLILVSWGEIEAMEGVELNDQPIENFPTAQVHKRFGVVGQETIPGFNAIANTFAQNVDLSAIGGGFPGEYIYTTNRVDCDALEVLLTIPGLSSTDDSGRVRENTTGYKVEYKRTGVAEAWTNIDAPTNFKNITASTRTTFFETRRIEGLTPAQYDVKITWLAAAHTDPAKDQWHIWLTGMTEEKQDERNYEQYALLGVTGIAAEQLNGALPVVTCIASGVKFQQFDGAAFTPKVFSRSPAWNTLGVVRDTRFGLGNRIKDSQIALVAFKAWADWCDENYHVVMDNGTEFDEKRHFLDVVLNQPSPARDLLLKLFRAGRASYAFLDGVLTPIMDREGVPVQMFGMGDIEAGTFQIQYQMTAGLTNSFDVTINDESRNYDPNTKEVVSRQEVIILGRPVKSQQITRECTTRMTQAVRDTRMELNAMHYLRRIVTFGASANAILAQPGDLIRIAHDAAGWGFSGRIMPGGNANFVHLSDPVVIDASQIYEITLHYNDTDVVEIVPVWGSDQPDGSGIYNRLYLHAAASQPPIEGDSYAFGPPNISTKPFRLLATTMTDESKRKLTALEYNASVVDDSGIITITPYTQLPQFGGGAAPIPFVNITEQVATRNDDRWVSDLIIQWPRPEAGREYGAYAGAKLERSFNYDPLNPGNAAWEDFDFVQGTEKRWQDIPHGMTIGIKVIPMAANGRFNTRGAAVGYITTLGYTTAPANVTGFVGFIKDNMFEWTWDDPGQQFQVEIRNANSGWGNNDPNVLLYRGQASLFIIPAPTTRIVQLYAKVIDAHHNVSVGAVSATVTSLAPNPPIFLGAVRTRAGISVTVAPPMVGTGHEIAMHLHASTDPAFVPATANRIAQTVSNRGGTFFIATTDPARMYFYATTEDWLSDRLNDWIYSARADSTILSVFPADPASVLVSSAPDPYGRGRGVGGNPVGSTPGQTVDILTPSRVDVYFDFTDNVSNPPASLIGFEIILYSASPAAPERSTGVVPAGEVTIVAGVQRVWSFYDVAFATSTTLYAAVRAVYVDGVVSDLVSSAGFVVMTANPNDPPITTTDSPVTQPYFEEFVRSAALPAGFTKGSGVTSVVVDPTGNGQLRFVVDGSANSWLDWDPFVWGTLYLDTKRYGAAAIVQLRMSAPINKNIGAINVLTDSGNSDGSTRSIGRVIDDGLLHNYSSLFGSGGHTLIYTGSSTPHVRFLFQGVTAATTITIDNIALAFFGYGLLLSGDIDRALQARNQFLLQLSDSYGPGGGYQLIAPVVHYNADGSIVIINDNGMFFTPAGASQALHGSYREGVRGSFNGIFAGFIVRMIGGGETDAYVHASNGNVVEPDIRTPLGMNRFRVMLQKTAGSVIDVAPTLYPVREWVEATDFQDAFTTGFLFSDFVFAGGALATFTDAGPWSPATTKKKSALTKGGGLQQLNAPGDGFAYPWAQNAWYHGKSLVPSVNVNTIYFRACPHVNVTMPRRLKADGTPFWVDVFLTIWMAEGQENAPTTNFRFYDPPLPSALHNGYNGNRNGPRFRLFADGGTRRIPIPTSNLTAVAMNLAGNPSVQTFADQCLVIGWWGSTLENGAPADAEPAAMEIDVQYDYLTPSGGNNPTWVLLANQNFNFVTYNEY